MTKKEIEANYIKLTPDQFMKIRNWSGLNLVQVRNGNRMYSKTEFRLFDPRHTKSNWKRVIISYSNVVDPRGFYERELQVSEKYLNPEFKYLLERC